MEQYLNLNKEDYSNLPSLTRERLENFRKLYEGIGGWMDSDDDSFIEMLSSIDDIDQYKIDPKKWAESNRIVLREDDGMTLLFFALHVISDACDIGGIDSYPDIDEIVRLLVEKGANVNYKYKNISVKKYINHLCKFYSGKIKKDNLFVYDFERNSDVSSTNVKLYRKVFRNIKATVKKADALKLRTFEHGYRTKVKQGTDLPELDEGVKERIAFHLRGKDKKTKKKPKKKNKPKKKKQSKKKN
jgi:hypothetical protein